MANPFDQFDAEPASGNPFDAFDAKAPEPIKMAMSDFRQEVAKRARAGQTPEEIRAFAETVRNPDDPTGTVRYQLGPDLETAVGSVERGYSGPIRVQDVTERSAPASAARGALDAATFNFGDEATAALKSAFGPGTYAEYVQQERAQRAMDDPTARGFGEAAGMIGSAMIPVGRIAGAGLEAISAAPRAVEALRGGLGVRQGMAVGAGQSALSGYGASQSNEEALVRLPGDILTGATIGGALPAAARGAKWVGREVRDIFNPELAAKRALDESGLDVNRIAQSAEEIRQTQGREPSIAELLTQEEAGRFSDAFARSRDVRTRLVNELNAKQTELGAGIESRVKTGPPVVPPREPGTAVTPYEGPAEATIRPSGPEQIARQETALTVPPSGVGQWGREIPDEGATEAAQRPFERIVLPDVPILRIETPGKLRQKAKEFGDIAWGKFRDIPFKLDDKNAVYFDEKIWPNVSLPRAVKDMVAERYATGTMTIGDMDLIRRSLGAQAKSGGTGNTGAKVYSDLKDDVLAMMAERVPETKQAVSRYAALMQAAEGADVGLRASKPGSDLVKFVDEAADLSPRARAGLAPGARAELVAQSMGNPAEVLNLATQLETKPGFQKRLQVAIGRNESDDLIRYAVQQKRGIEALFAMAKIPNDQVDSVLRRADGIVNMIAATSFGVGGAFKANLVNHLIARAKIGEKPAAILADNLLNPERSRATLAAMGNLTDKSGKKLHGKVKDVVNYALLRTAASVGADNAQMPEGAISVKPMAPVE